MAALWGAGMSRAQTVFTWPGGSLPTTVLVADDTLDITTTADHDFNATAWTNNGTVNWQGGQLRSGGAGSITNHGTWNDSAGSSANNAYGGTAWTFTNSSDGTYNKSGAGTTAFSVPFLNHGTVSVTAGTLDLAAGGTSTGGTFTASGTGVIKFSDGYTLGGTVTFGGNGLVHLTGGTLAGTGTVDGQLTWTTGSIASLTFAPDATLTIASTGNHDFNAATWTNNGTVSWTGGPIRSGGAGGITNHGTWNDTASNALNNAYGGTAWTFTNSSDGTYNKTAAGTTDVGVPFVNHGSVSVTAGTLQLGAGGSSSGGQFTAASGAVIDFTSGYSLTGTVTFAGAGAARLSGGTLSGPATVEGPFTWLAGSVSNLTFGTTAVLTIGGTGNHDFNAASWTNNGTVNWTGGPIRSGGAGSITNHGTWNDSASNALNNAYGGTAWTFTNASDGNYNKTAAGTTTVGVPFVNQGDVNVTGGTLDLAGGGGGNNGSYTAGSGAVIDISSNFSVTGTVTFAGAGLVKLTGGTLSGTGTIEGPLTWTGGAFSSPPVFGSSSVLTIAGTGNHDFNATSWTNNGTVNWTGGPIRSGGAGSHTNNSVWNDTASSVMNNDYGGTAWTFTNSASGTYNKTAAGTTTIDLPFVNQGDVNVTGGTLRLTGGGGGNNGNYTAGSGATLEIASNFSVTGTVTFAGPGLVTLTAGTLSGPGTIAGPLTWTGGTLGSPPVFGSDSTLTIAGTGNHDFNGIDWTTHGTVNWTGGPLRSGGAGSITNHGTWNDSASSSANNDYGGTAWTFTNANGGTYKKTTTGTTGFDVPFVNGGTLAAGAGLLDFTGGLTLESTGRLEFSLGGSARGTSFGAVNADSSVVLGGSLDLRFISGYQSTVTNADTFTLLTLTAGTLSGAFANVGNGGTLWTLDGLGSFRVNYGAGSAFAANSVVLSHVVAVPEPSTWALLATGLAALLLRATRRRG